MPTAYAEDPGTGAAAMTMAADVQRAVATETELSDTTAGAYQDGRIVVVNVTSDRAAARARRAGAKPRMVQYSSRRLRATESTLNQTVNMPGTSWVIDPVTNRVVVSADSSVTGAKLDELRAAVARLGGTVRMEQVAGVFSTRVTGGDAIFTGRSRCSLGFNVRRGRQTFFLTAGHCTQAGQRWSDGRQTIGQAVSSSFPGNDYALVQYTAAVERPGAVSLYRSGARRDLVRAGNAVVGQAVERSGSTTGLHRGQVTGLNATVNYADGRVTGLIRTNVCAEPGDSGGALVSGDTALGLTSGGSGNCRTGGVTFFQPVTEALRAFNVQIY